MLNSKDKTFRWQLLCCMILFQSSNKFSTSAFTHYFNPLCFQLSSFLGNWAGLGFFFLVSNGVGFCFVDEQGVMKTINVNKLTSAGCKVKIWIADWFAQLNNKMGGDLKKIQTVGRYLIEIWKAVGMNLEDGQVEFLWSSEEINSRAHEYWPLVMDIARRNKLPRILRYDLFSSTAQNVSWDE